jgi:hypothetical protein
MKRLAWLILVLSSVAYGQSTGICRKDFVVAQDAMGRLVPVAGASVRVCAEDDTASPCTAISLYSDSALTKPVDNPVITDASGNYGYCAGNITAVERVTGNGIKAKTYKPVTMGNFSDNFPTGMAADAIRMLVGGDPTGTADSTSFISSALTLAATGKSVTINPGTYKVTSAISVTQTRAIHLTAEGVTIASTVAEPSSPGAVINITGNATHPVYIRGLTISHSGSTTAGLLDGLKITNAKHVTLDNVSASGVSDYGIEVAAEDSTLTNCKGEYNYYGGANLSGHFVVSGGSYSHNGTTIPTNGYGMIAGGVTSSGSVISGARFESNKRYGIDGRYSKNLTIGPGNYIYDSGFMGIEADNYGTNGAAASGLRIIENTIDMNGQTGAGSGSLCIQSGSYFSSTEAPTISPSLIIEGNVCKGFYTGGINLFYYKANSTDANRMQHVTIKNNIIDATGSTYAWGIYGTQPNYGGVDMLQIEGNILRNGSITIPTPGGATTNMFSMVKNNTIVVDNGVTLAKGFDIRSDGSFTGNDIQTIGTGTVTAPFYFPGTNAYIKGNTNNGVKYPAESLKDDGTHLGIGDATTWSWPLSVRHSTSTDMLAKFTGGSGSASTKPVVGFLSSRAGGSAADFGTWTSLSTDWIWRACRNVPRNENNSLCDESTAVIVGGMKGDGTFVWGQGANNQAATLETKTELITIAAAATTDSVFSVPGGAIVFGVGARVVSAIPTAATFTITGAATGTSYATGVSTAAGATVAGTSNCPKVLSQSDGIRITPNATPGDATGTVRITVYYLRVMPPTS